MQGGNGNRTRLQLHLYASNLPRVGLRKSPPDTSAMVAFANESQEFSTAVKGPVEATEIVQKSCHPHWTTVFNIEYEQGTKQFFTVYIMRHLSDEKEPECFGRAKFEVSDVLESKQTKARTFRDGGCMFVHIHPVTDPYNQEKLFRFQIHALHIDVKTKQKQILKGAPDTLIEIAKRQVSPGGYTWITVYRSTPALTSHSPIWGVGELDLETCCNGDLHHPLRLSVWLYKQGAHETLLGMCETTLDCILHACTNDATSNGGVPEDKTLFLQKPPSRSIKNHGKVKESGRLGVKLAQIINPWDASSASECDRVTVATADGGDDDSTIPSPPRSFSRPSSIHNSPKETYKSPLPNFEDYVKDGFVFDFFTALDLTSSNGDPRVPGTLHYRTEGRLNEYESCIKAVGDAIEGFSDSRQCTVWGFGAKFGGAIKHIFQCGASSVVVGVQGILEAYRSVFQSDLTLSSPPVLINVIQAAAVRARKLQQNGASRNRYCVLLIITAGALRNIGETKRKLITYSEVPLSVIIVGVGNADVAEMDSFNDFASGLRRNVTFFASRDHRADPDSLGKTALRGVQDQVVEYMTRNKIYPSSYG